MTTISIFIASSSRDTTHERVVIGDAVRMLSDQYESRGYRLRLNCWEDFTPEFTGERKQTEYNEVLIKNSQIFIALFREVCGNYTQEEVKLWHTELGNTPSVFDIQDPLADKTKVDSFLTAEGLKAAKVSNDKDICEQLEALVVDYVRSHPLVTPQIDTTPTKTIYATIPEDRSIERAPFGNLIRSVDDIAEKFFHYRCRLIQKDSSQIVTSDYYAAILKDHATADEEGEVLTAISTCASLKKPYVVLYYNYRDTICMNHPAIGTAISKHGVFNEPYDSLCRVKYNLVKWLIQQSVLRLDLSTGIDIEEDWFMFCGLPVIRLSALGIKAGSVVQQVAELLQHLSFSILGVNTCTDTRTGVLDLQKLEDQISRAKAMLNASSQIEQAATSRMKELLEQVSGQIDIILSGEVTVDNIAVLATLIQKKELLLEELHAEPREILRAQMLLVQVHDSYPLAFEQTAIDIDHQYLKVSETADRYGISDPTVEMMRFNYANYLSRQNNNKEALALYEQVMANLERLDNRSALNRCYTMHLYITYINHLMFLGERERADIILLRLEVKEKEWEGYGLSMQERVANISRILACRLRKRPVQSDIAEILDSAMAVFLEAVNIPQELFDPGIRDEVYCDLPICMMSTIIDGYEYHRMPIDQLSHNIDVLFNHVLKYTSQHPDDEACMTHRGSAYHNMAFFSSMILHNQREAREFCFKALAVRREIYAKREYANNLYDVAETLLLLGATYVNGIKVHLSNTDYREALAYADECLSLYEALNKEKYLSQETRVYQAMQLKGSILYYGGDKKAGLSLLRRVWEWNELNPSNDYSEVFKGVAGYILAKEN